MIGCVFEHVCNLDIFNTLHINHYCLWPVSFKRPTHPHLGISSIAGHTVAARHTVALHIQHTYTSSTSLTYIRRPALHRTIFYCSASDSLGLRRSPPCCSSLNIGVFYMVPLIGSRLPLRVAASVFRRRGCAAASFYSTTGHEAQDKKVQRKTNMRIQCFLAASWLWHLCVLFTDVVVSI